MLSTIFGSFNSPFIWFTGLSLIKTSLLIQCICGLQSSFQHFLNVNCSSSCIFVSNLDGSSAKPTIQQNHTAEQGLFQGDLVMNVFRDGHWGSFRHQILPHGTDAQLRKTSLCHSVNVWAAEVKRSDSWDQKAISDHNQTLFEEWQLLNLPSGYCSLFTASITPVQSN